MWPYSCLRCLCCASHQHRREVRAIGFLVQVYIDVIAAGLLPLHCFRVNHRGRNGLQSCGVFPEPVYNVSDMSPSWSRSSQIHICLASRLHHNGTIRAFNSPLWQPRPQSRETLDPPTTSRSLPVGRCPDYCHGPREYSCTAAARAGAERQTACGGEGTPPAQGSQPVRQCFAPKTYIHRGIEAKGW